MPVKKIETLAEIENELRSLSRSAADSCRYNERTAVFGKPLFVYLSEVADRIHAAADREVVVSKIATTTPGNAAAMREALVEVRDKLPYFLQYMRLRRTDDDGGYYDRLLATINAALAEPPRNCDRFNSCNPAKDAEDSYNEWQWHCDCSLMPLSCKGEYSFRQWLFTKYETKGEGDGSK